MSIKKPFVTFSIVLGCLYVVLAVICAIFIKNLFLSILINAFSFAPFYALLCKSVKPPLSGNKSYHLESGALFGAWIFLIFALISFSLNVYVFVTRFMSWAILGLIPTLFSIAPAVIYFNVAKNATKSFLTKEYSVCNKCYTITKKYSSCLIGARSHTTYTTTTSREKIGEIHSNDYNQKYDVYGDVSRISAEKSTIYSHRYSFECSNCGNQWGETVTSSKRYS